jgi:serine/threonine-protein kinase
MHTLGYGGRIDPRGETGQVDPEQVLRHLADTSATVRWDFEATLPELVPEGETAAPDQRGDIFPVGHLVGGCYEIRGLLGAGGMGQVFEAHDRGLNRLVALKAAWSEVGPEPLRREAQVLAAFRHPGLVTVHALGREGQIEYMVMERLAGSTLADALIRSPEARLPLGECVEMLTALCHALRPLHESGLAHADLKPTNIMMLPGGRLVLLDFGIARIEQLRAGSQRITGSPHYMAPEAVRGAVQVGEAHLVDLYAVGVIGFAALAGAPPYDATNAVEIMLQHINVPTPHVSERRPGVPPALDRLLADLMAKHPHDRPANVEVVLTELQHMRTRR